MSKNEVVVPSRFERVEVGEWNLWRDPALPLRIMSSASGMQKLIILGMALCPGLLHPRNFFSCGVDIRREDLSKAIVDWLRDHTGRFIVIMMAKDSAEVYPDALACLGVVYEPIRKVVASSVTLMLLDQVEDDYFARDPSRFPGNTPCQFFPGHLTVRSPVRRLLPNHSLNLVTWKPRRFWPTAPFASLTGEMVATEIKERLTGNVTSLGARLGCLTLPITAGFDSRVLLAVVAAERMSNRVTLISFRYSREFGTKSTHDVSTGLRLAAATGFKHVIIDVKKNEASVDDEHRRYQTITGVCGGPGKSHDFYKACVKHLDMAAGLLTGFGGEVGRAAYWKFSLLPVKHFSASDIVSALGLPLRLSFVNAVQCWLHSLPADLSAELVLDLAFLELRVGGWSSPHFYGFAPFALVTSPYSDRRILEAMLSAPPEWRQQDRLPRMVVAQSFKPLLDVPVDSGPWGRGPKEATRKELYNKVSS